MEKQTKTILIIGATGLQGGAVAERLQAENNYILRAISRDPQSPAASALASLGVKIYKANFDEAHSLDEAVCGVDAIFSMSNVDASESGKEQKQAQFLINSAIEYGVKQFVHTSVAAAGNHQTWPKWNENYWWKAYWLGKWEVEAAIHNAEFPFWTILKPALLMENFLPPKVHHMYPELRTGEIISLKNQGTASDFISASDVAAFAMTAFSQPEKFNRQSIALSSGKLSMNQVAQIISEVTGKTIKAVSISAEQAREKGISEKVIRNYEWENEIGYNVDIAALEKFGIRLTSFKEWAENNKTRFIID